MLYRAVVFRIDGALPSEAKLLMEDFRLAVNCAVRAGLQAKVTSRHALVKLLYKDFWQDHPGMYSQHLVCSFEVADVMMVLYDPVRGARPEPNGTSASAGVA